MTDFAQWAKSRYPALFDRPTLVARAVVALELGLLVGWIVYVGMKPGQASHGAHDLTWAWRGARALSLGQDPYEVIQATGPYPYNAPFKYPLATALLALPLAGLDAAQAAAVFVGASLALFVFAVTVTSFAPLIALVSACALVTAVNVQFSLLLIAAALLPPLGFVLAMKPTLGFALFCWRPRLATVLGCAVVALVSFLMVPTWPMEWIAAMRSDPARGAYVPPIARWYGGPLLGLAVLRWRRPEARLLLGLACVPHATLFYDELALVLIGASVAEYTLLAGLSFVAWILAYSTPVPLTEAAKAAHHAPYVIWLLYVPALAIVLRRPNVGPARTIMNRAAGRLSRFIREQAP